MYRHGKCIPHHYIFPSPSQEFHTSNRGTCATPFLPPITTEHLPTQGRVDPPTLTALERVRQSGRKLILVTGRHLPDLQSVFSRLDLFDRAVLENGALLYTPETKQERLLCEPPPLDLQEALLTRSVPFSTGRGILATWEPNKTAVLEAIHDLGLDLQVIFNKGAVMVLPSGINKASGLKAALNELSLSFHNAVGIGDAENDHAFLAVCECGVAVANALPLLKERADIVTAGDHRAGLIEIANQLLDDDLARHDVRLSRHSISLGTRADKSGEGEEVRISPSRNGQSPPLLVAAPKADQERRRHLRQYAQGELSPNQSFYFRGPESKLHPTRAKSRNVFANKWQTASMMTPGYSTSAAVIIPPGSRT
jgi:hydroxymethylpyrimidine pyrophosphatase-like HAD family hydrolase